MRNKVAFKYKRPFKGVIFSTSKIYLNIAYCNILFLQQHLTRFLKTVESTLKKGLNSSERPDYLFQLTLIKCEKSANLRTNYVLCGNIFEMLQFVLWNRILVAKLQLKETEQLNTFTKRKTSWSNKYTNTLLMLHYASIEQKHSRGINSSKSGKAILHPTRSITILLQLFLFFHIGIIIHISGNQTTFPPEYT